MKKLFSLSIFVFLFMFAFLASTKAFAKNDNNNAGGSGNSNSFGLSNPNRPENNSGQGNSEDRPRKLTAESVLNRFTGAVKHIEKFILRLDAAILQFKTTGSDTAIAEGFLASAKTDLTEAQAHFQDAKNAYDGGAFGAKGVIREHLGLMKIEIRSSFENLKATVRALKDLRVSSDDDSDDDDTDEDNSGTN